MAAMSKLMALFGLYDRRVLVTGAARGVGAAIAERFADAGAHVYVHYRASEEDAHATVGRIRASGGMAQAVKADLSTKEGVNDLFCCLSALGGTPDVLVNNAGIYPSAELTTMTEEGWRAMFDANVTTTFLCTQRAAVGMKRRRGGAIINIASIAASIPGPAHAHYNSAKAAVVMFTRSAAQELGSAGIRVNAVSPGLVWRASLERDWPEGLKAWNRKVPLGRATMPDDVANACLYLASDAAAFITGHNLCVDGGMTSAPIY